jgi:hypothetical protein
MSIPLARHAHLYFVPFKLFRDVLQGCLLFFFFALLFRAFPLVELPLFFPAELTAIERCSEFCIGRLSTCWQDLCGFGRDPLDTMHNALGCLIACRHRSERMICNCTIRTSRCRVSDRPGRDLAARRRRIWLRLLLELLLWLLQGRSKSTCSAHCALWS